MLKKIDLRTFFLSHLQVELANIPGPFGEGLLVTTVEGRAIVTATPNANPIFRDVITSVFNNSYLLDVTLTSHGTFVFYFVKVRSYLLDVTLELHMTRSYSILSR